MRHRGSRALLVGLVATALIAGCQSSMSSATPSSPTGPSPQSSSYQPAPASSLAARSAAAPSSAPPMPIATIVAVGDVALGNTPSLPRDPVGYLAPMRAVLSAPIVFGNLEGALTNASLSKCPPPPPPSPLPTPPPTPSSPPTTSAPPTPSASPAPKPPSCFAFRMPTSYAKILRGAGFTVLNSANNHSHDFGPRGIADTSAALGGAGITQIGLPGQTGIIDVSGVRVAFIGFAPYATTNNLLDDVRAHDLIASARQTADLVVVYMHAGAEGSAATHVAGDDEWYLGENRGNPKGFAHAAIDAGADLVVASGPHVLRGMEYYRSHLIAYSLGDFVGYGNFSTTGPLALSGALRISLDATGRPTSARFTSMRLDGTGRPAVDPAAQAAKFVNELSNADFGASAAVIDATGDIHAR